MRIRLFNTLKRVKQDFIPIDEKRVRLYVCGPTVYDFAHIGNARPVVVFDVLYRLLQKLYGKDHVVYARNITDVDDKIIARAAETQETIGTLTARTEKAFIDDMTDLGALTPDIQPRATEHIDVMIKMIESLILGGHAYEAQGHVLFSITSYDEYGHLSGRNRDEMIAGARVEVAPYKQDPADFVLWKPSLDDQPGWQSPWGKGRPGWHIECSAMSEKHLGKTFDIHGGGQDLIFPHHENEVAQSTCAHGGTAFVNYWLHNGYLLSEGEKMSKSLGNFYTVHDLLNDFPGEAIRLVLLKTQYRKPLDFSRGGIVDAKHELDKLYRVFLALKDITAAPVDASPEVIAALCDDLNTPKALAALHELCSTADKPLNKDQAAVIKGQILSSANLLGILQHDPEQWFKGLAKPQAGGLSDGDIQAMIDDRKHARAYKNFAESDRIRDELLAQNIILEDSKDGTTWRRQ